ncbi:unnamed protein product [Closterium sp. NIES-65]|nr:unnamed protein product [Closterium sp. NIES-65]
MLGTCQALRRADSWRVPFLPFALHSLTPPSPLSALPSFALPCQIPSLSSPRCALPSFTLPAIPSPRHSRSLPDVPSFCPVIPPLCALLSFRKLAAPAHVFMPHTLPAPPSPYPPHPLPICPTLSLSAPPSPYPPHPLPIRPTLSLSAPPSPYPPHPLPFF